MVAMMELADLAAVDSSRCARMSSSTEFRAKEDTANTPALGAKLA